MVCSSHHERRNRRCRQVESNYKSNGSTELASVSAVRLYRVNFHRRTQQHRDYAMIARNTIPPVSADVQSSAQLPAQNRKQPKAPSLFSDCDGTASKHPDSHPDHTTPRTVWSLILHITDNGSIELLPYTLSPSIVHYTRRQSFPHLYFHVDSLLDSAADNPNGLPIFPPDMPDNLADTEQNRQFILTLIDFINEQHRNYRIPLSAMDQTATGYKHQQNEQRPLSHYGTNNPRGAIKSRSVSVTKVQYGYYIGWKAIRHIAQQFRQLGFMSNIPEVAPLERYCTKSQLKPGSAQYRGIGRTLEH